jgi:hypothetical protein
VTDQLPEQRRRDALSQPVIHFHLDASVPTDRLSQLLKHLRRFRGAETVDLTISRVNHPAMPGAVLADIAVLTPDGVCRVLGVGRTPDAAIERVREHLTGEQRPAPGSAESASTRHHDRRSS